MPQVAIITRTHNRPLLLARSVASVGSQSFSDYTQIIINDRGDRSAIDAIVNELPQSQRAVTEVIDLSEDDVTGREGVVNPGFDRARELGAEFVVVLDDDDSWDPDFLEVSVSTLRAHPDFAAAATQSMVIFETIEGDTVTETSRELLAADKTAVSLEDILIENFIPPVALVFRVQFLEDLHGWNPDLPVLADWDFLLRLMLLGPVKYILQPLANWHRRPQATGNLGNSVVVAANDHRIYHAVIRERYLRQSNTNPLGLALLLAHYKNELHEDNRASQAAVASHLEAVKAIQLAEIDELHVELERLENKLNEVTELVKTVHQRLDNRSLTLRLRQLLQHNQA